MSVKARAAAAGKGPVMGVPGGPKPPMSRIIFNKWDADGNGTLDKDEFHAMCLDFGYNFSESELKTAVNQIDHNGNGLIEYDEFIDWWSKSDRFSHLSLDDETLKRVETYTSDFRAVAGEKGVVINKGANFETFFTNMSKLGLTGNKNSSDKLLAEITGKDNADHVAFNEYMTWRRNKYDESQSTAQKTLLTQVEKLDLKK